MGIKIRDIKEKDYPRLIELFKEFSEFEKLPEKMVNSVERMTEEKDYITGFAAVNEDGMIVGYATYFFAYYTWIGKSMYLDDLYVQQEYRGKGLGTKLIGKVIEFAKSQKCNKIKWQVSEWNKPAIEFYKSLGADISSVESNCDLLLSQ